MADHGTRPTFLILHSFCDSEGSLVFTPSQLVYQPQTSAATLLAAPWSSETAGEPTRDGRRSVVLRDGRVPFPGSDGLQDVWILHPCFEHSGDVLNTFAHRDQPVRWRFFESL